MPTQFYRLTEARELRGYSVAELAEKLQVSRQSVYMYENGTQNPSVDIATLITETLDFPLSFFASPRVGIQIDDKPIFFRDMKTNVEKNRRMASRWLQLLYDRVLVYSKDVDLQPVNIPLFCVDDIEKIDMLDIDAYAEKTRRFWGLGNGPISDLTMLIENNGIIVSHKDFGTEKMDACSVIVDGRPCMLINVHRQTCSRILANTAHELGHIILHQNIDKRMINNTRTHDLLERQAWRFSSAFLMPPATFANELGYPTINQYLLLKKRWRTSIASMIMHSRELDIIDDERKQYLFRELSRQGWRKNEPMDDELPVEKGSLLFECERVITEAGIKTRDMLLHEASLNANDYCDLLEAPYGYFEPIRKKPHLRLVK